MEISSKLKDALLKVPVLAFLCGPILLRKLETAAKTTALEWASTTLSHPDAGMNPDHRDDMQGT